MPANSAGGTPYAIPTDPVQQWPATSQSVAAKIDTKAPLASPALTGTPTAPTAAAGTNTTQLATTAFVTTADNLKAPLASPTFTGTPSAPTPAQGDNDTSLATTAFVQRDAIQRVRAGRVVTTFTQLDAGNKISATDITVPLPPWPGKPWIPHVMFENDFGMWLVKNGYGVPFLTATMSAAQSIIHVQLHTSAQLFAGGNAVLLWQVTMVD
jgi:hypothetical protein